MPPGHDLLRARRQDIWWIRGKEKRRPLGAAFWDKNPGDDLLLHGLGHTTIGAAAFHFRVRDGIGWFHSAMVARERVEGRSGSVDGLTELCAHALEGGT